MPNAIDDFDYNPDSDKQSCDGPATAHGPKEAPESECEQRHINDDEAALPVF
jgi:hypothetical protein